MRLLPILTEFANGRQPMGVTGTSSIMSVWPGRVADAVGNTSSDGVQPSNEGTSLSRAGAQIQSARANRASTTTTRVKKLLMR